VELNLDQLPGFPFRRLPLPLDDRVLGRLGEYGMTPLDFHGLHRATRADNDLDLDVSLQVHGAGHVWIWWDHSVHDFAGAFRSYLSIRLAGNHNQSKAENKGNNGDDSPSWGRHALENKGIPMFAERSLP
jgi:hypothetical protein